MAPGRHRSRSNAAANNAPTTSPQRFESPVAAHQPKRQLGMSAAVYENNMKVLLRREPSIMSIFDQFSHVCVYSYNGSKWERGGYEGSMFLFERKTYPPYGLFILNRTATDDYIQFIHPEDDIEIMGDYLMYRYYPDFTRRRLELGLPYPIPPTHRAQFDREMDISVATSGTPLDKEQSAKGVKEKKGASVTIGLWMFSTDARVPLKDVIMRLHSYIKRGEPYPDEYRYGPGKPPPPNPHLRTASRTSNASSSHDYDAREGQRTVTQVSQVTTVTQTTRAATPSGASELDKLFAKLVPSVPSTPANDQRVASTAPNTTSSMSVRDLFAALGGPELSQPAPSPAAPAFTFTPAAAPPPAPTSSTPNRGLALLDSIFASATAGPAQPPLSSQLHNTAVHAPAMQSSSSLPTQPEEICIVSPKPTSNTLPQILNQDIFSTLLGLGAGSRAASAAPSSTSSHNSGPNRYEGDNEYSDGGDLASDGEPSPRRVEGDVTPRPPMRGFGSASPPPPAGQNLVSSISARTNGLARPPSARSVTASPAPAPDTVPGPRPRTLVPFQPDSELWPYPRAPLDDRAEDGQDADFIELDFADTRALSDPAIFSSRLKERQSRAGAKKKTRKERAAEREREREEIENGWDDPVRGQAQGLVPVPSAGVAQGPAGETPAVNGHALVNGKGKQSVAPASPEEMPRVNGHATNGGISTGAAKDAVVNALSSHPARPSPALPRNDFVRELLLLLHTDKAFVDRLWQDYTVRTT